MSRFGRKQANEHQYDASTDYENTAIDSGFSQTDSGRLIRSEALKVQPTRSLSPSPPTLDDAYAAWKPTLVTAPTPLNAEETEEDITDELEDDMEDTAEGAGTGQKRKRYESSDNPNAAWRRNAIELLHELFRFDGLGDSLAAPCCSTCGTTRSHQAASAGTASACRKPEATEGNRLFRCVDCNPLLECQPCLLKRHKSVPLHRIQEWNGVFYDRVALSELGLVYQLGHGGLPCLSPDQTNRKMVVLEANGIHEIAFRYCDCQPTHKPSHVQQLMRAGLYPATTTDPQTCATFRVLDLYRELNVRATVNANDFIKVLLHLTNPIDLNKIPDRYKVFARMARQWAFLHRLKRSGVGIDLKCLDDIQPGALAVLCWACPNLDLNLTEDCLEKASKDSYLYMPILALDANFRLKNRLRQNERADPELSPGSAYFVSPQCG